MAILNHGLADELGLDLRGIPPESAAALFAGQAIPLGAQPIAQAYAGHQYGGFTMLGDGRAILLGEHRTPSGRLVDIQFKGSGKTRFSRRRRRPSPSSGQCCANISSAKPWPLSAFPTTRSLAVVTTGEPVHRESHPTRSDPDPRGRQPHPGRYLRVRSPSRRSDPPGELADYAIARHYPELSETPQGSIWSSSARSRTVRPRWSPAGNSSVSSTA